jgi:hypothetical protein
VTRGHEFGDEDIATVSGRPPIPGGMGLLPSVD